MKNILYCKCLLVFFLCSISLSLVAERHVYAPDTIIKYNLLSKDTLVKQPISMETFLYDNKFRLKEKSLFTWNLAEKKWVKNKKFELNYFPTEIVVNCFNVEGKNQEIQTQRILAQLDQQAHIVEVNFQRKDRYSSTFNLFEKKKYSYKHDSILLEQHFKMINQLVLDREVKYGYSKDLIVQKKATYDLTGKETSSLQRRIQLKGGKISRIQSIESFMPKDTMLEKFEYIEQGLSKIITNLICSNKEKGKHVHKPEYPNQILYDYNQDGNLIYEVKTKLNHENLVQIDRENYLIRLIYSSKTPKSSINKYEFPKLDDFLK